MWQEQLQDDEDTPREYKPGLPVALVTLLLILALPVTLIWPLLQSGPRRLPTPMPLI